MVRRFSLEFLTFLESLSLLLFVYDCHCFLCQYYDWSGGPLVFQMLMPQAEATSSVLVNTINRL